MTNKSRSCNSMERDKWSNNFDKRAHRRGAPKIAPSPGDLRLTHSSSDHAPVSPHPKRHLDRFKHFITVHVYVQTHTTRNVANKSQSKSNPASVICSLCARITRTITGSYVTADCRDRCADGVHWTYNVDRRHRVDVRHWSFAVVCIQFSCDPLFHSRRS